MPQTNILETLGTFDPAAALTELHLADGRILSIPTSLLNPDPAPSVPLAANSSADSFLIPIIEEQLDVSKRTVTSGTVRLEKTVEAYEASIQEPLAHVTWRVDRVALNQPVDLPPAVRVEGDTTIYPLLEEQLILTKQLILREEIRVTREESHRPANQTVTLRREHLTVDRQQSPDQQQSQKPQEQPQAS